jgi:tetratricopeptide (TPR) repeat protein
MPRIITGRATAVFSIVILSLGLICCSTAPAQSDDLDALYKRVTELYQAGKYAEAVPLAERYAEATKTRYGSEAPQYATALNNLAQLLKDANRPAEAEPLFRRALAIDEKSLGPYHPHVARDLNNLAELLKDANRPAEAKPLYARALAIYESSGPTPMLTGRTHRGQLASPGPLGLAPPTRPGAGAQTAEAGAVPEKKMDQEARACLQLSRIIAAANCTPARKFLASLS